MALVMACCAGRERQTSKPVGACAGLTPPPSQSGRACREFKEASYAGQRVLEGLASQTVTMLRVRTTCYTDIRETLYTDRREDETLVVCPG
jgi:hypothetical protein